MAHQYVSDALVEEVYRTVDRLDGHGNAVNGEPTVQQVVAAVDRATTDRSVRRAFEKLVAAGRIDTHMNVSPAAKSVVRTATTDVSSDSDDGPRSRVWTTDGLKVEGD